MLMSGRFSVYVKDKKMLFYLKYRENAKVVSKYVDTEISKLQGQTEKRKHIRTMIKVIEDELKYDC